MMMIIMKKSRKLFTMCPKVDKGPKAILTPKNARSLHGALKWVLVLTQCFGQMPVLGINGPNADYLKFDWKTLRTFYCSLNCVGSGFIAGFYLYRWLTKGADLLQYSTIAFHVSTFAITLSFLQLSREWPELMRQWSLVELSMMRSYGYPPHLRTRITFMSVTVLSIATIEFLLTKISKIILAFKCKKEEENFTEYYFTMSLYEDITHALGYALWKSILLQIENVLMAFAWTFNDLFIMLMSTALALRFKQITGRLRLLQKKLKMDDVRIWREIREDYNRLSRFTKHLDEALSYIILISFASNLFFILLQLFNSLRVMKDNLEKVYFFVSFAFLILRTFCVTLYGAWIYEESREPMAILNSVSSDIYNVEVKRFMEQIQFDTVALTGKKFFYLTRGVILSMAGAVVTYELVLIQFNENVLKDSAEHARNSSGIC